MDSLNALGNSLPPANLANAEKDLLNTFKAAAQSITTLYRASRHTSKRAYNAGYVQACEDLLRMIRHGLSDAGRTSGDDGAPAMDVGRVMDWVDARLEAIRAREEEEDEEEERERTRASAPTQPRQPPVALPAATTATAAVTANEHRLAMPPTAPAPPPGPAVVPTPAPTSPPTSPISSPTPTPSRPIYPLPAHALRGARGLAPTTSTSTAATTGAPAAPNVLAPSGSSTPGAFRFPSSYDSLAFDAVADSVAAGAKRRHALMLALNDNGSPTVHGPSVDPISPTGSGASTPAGAVTNATGPGPHGRRRTRSVMRTAVSGSQMPREEEMDVDEGRERKRVARR